MSRNSVTSWAIALAVTSASATAATAQVSGDDHTHWNVDASHTGIEFSVRHFFTPVRGSFQDFEIDLRYDRDNPENSTVSVTIDVASVETNNQRRNNHLRTPDFFDADRFPTIAFTSSAVRQISDTELVATGTLTIRETSVEIELPITILGVMPLPSQMQQPGRERVAGFAAEIEIDRRDFEVGTGSWAETAVVGADVVISISLEAGQ